MFWAQRKLAAEGFTMMTVPALARPSAFVATGHFPGHEEEAYEIPKDDLYLAGTGEIALTSLHSGEIIEADKLPILYAGYSPCFRREAGSAGRDVRGLRSEEHTSELQSLMRTSYAVFCLKKKNKDTLATLVRNNQITHRNT